MKAVVTGKEMKTIDSYTIDKLGIPSLALMECAAWSVVRHMVSHIGKETAILCICGSGNNGGDAVCVARILYGMGYDSRIFMAGNPKKWTEETKKQIQIARNIGVPEYNEIDLTDIQVVVDGLFGIGLSSFVREPFRTMIQKVNEWRSIHPKANVWSVDIPSGLSSDTGQALGAAIQADYTVTFGYMKRGMILYPGRNLSGECYVEDIGFPEKSLAENLVEGWACEIKDLAMLPKRKSDSNKGDYGKIVVVAGSKNMSGAAMLAAEAAYRCGAGLVKIVTPETNRIILQTGLPQAMISVWEELDDKELEKIVHWADAVVIGPGIGTGDFMAQAIEKLLSVIKCPMIIDADGLNLLATHEVWYDRFDYPVIVTPHMGEMSRLTGKSMSELKADRAEAAKEYAKSRKLVCVLKDSSTVISDGKQICFNQTGNAGMATGGSGDVLAGILGVYLGMGMKPFEAACIGTYLHGLAGDAAAARYGMDSMTSAEMIEGLMEVLKSKKRTRG